MSRKIMSNWTGALAVLCGLAFANSALAQNNNNQNGGGFGIVNNRVGGVQVNVEGVVSKLDDAGRIPLRDTLRKMHAAPSADLAGKTEMRMVSLKALEAAVKQSKEKVAENLPDELRFLAGIQRIQYVFIYPEENDIVLAGPGEGWKVDDRGAIVGATTGRPVLRLEDLLVALRTVESARSGSITCSIDPTPEGRQRLDALLSKQTQYSNHVLGAIRKAVGPQTITVTGVPPESHFARILVASDYHMKRIGMKLDPSPVKQLPSFVDILKQDNVPLDNMMPRWWMACDYQPLARSEDGLAFELRGRGVKVMTEEEVADAHGNVSAAGRSNSAAQKWADLMTKNFDELATKEASFGELRNLMDMCVVSALITKEGLLAKANCSLPTLTEANSPLGYLALQPAKTVETQVSSLKRGREYIITASGGVEISSWAAADKTEPSAAVGQVRQKAKPASKVARAWWN